MSSLYLTLSLSLFLVAVSCWEGCGDGLLLLVCRAFITFGINALHGRVKGHDGVYTGPWDAENARFFIRHIVQNKQYVDSWEFGSRWSLCSACMHESLSSSDLAASFCAKATSCAEMAANPTSSWTASSTGWTWSPSRRCSSMSTLHSEVHRRSRRRVGSTSRTGTRTCCPPRATASSTSSRITSTTSAQVIHLLRLPPRAVLDRERCLTWCVSGGDGNLVDKVTDPKVLGNIVRTYDKVVGTIKSAGPWSSAWVGESGGAHSSGGKGLSNTFANSFWWG